MAVPIPPPAQPVPTQAAAERAGLGRLLTGTRPGLERVLLGSVPAFVAGSLGGVLIAPWAGLGLALAVFAGVWILSKGSAD